MTKKEALTPPPLTLMFELILRGSGLFMDSKDWRECRTAFHVDWLKPLIDLWAIEHIGSEPASWPEGADRGGRGPFNYHNYAVTPAGMEWWIDERVKEVEDGNWKCPTSCENLELSRFTEWHGERPPLIDGKGIGSVLYLHWWPDIAAGFKGLAAGYFKFEYYDWGHPRYRSFDRLKVSLTEKGYWYFDSLPRLKQEPA